MKLYTKEEFEIFYKPCRDNFRNIVSDIVAKYTSYLNNLLNEDKDNGYKTREAFLRKQELYYSLSDFIQKTYPKTGEEFINGNVYYTVQTKAYFNLATEELCEADTIFQKLYLDFHGKIFPEHITL